MILTLTLTPLQNIVVISVNGTVVGRLSPQEAKKFLQEIQAQHPESMGQVGDPDPIRGMS